VVVQAHATEWYLLVPLFDRDCRVELGYRLGGGWLPLAVSSVARVPAEGPNPVATDAFAPFSLEGPIGPLSQPWAAEAVWSTNASIDLPPRAVCSAGGWDHKARLRVLR
jgi:hypothetical protein